MVKTKQNGIVHNREGGIWSFWKGIPGTSEESWENIPREVVIRFSGIIREKALRKWHQAGPLGS